MLETLRQAAVYAHPAAFWIVCAAASVFAWLALRFGLGAFWRLRLMGDTPTAKIRSAPQGYIELVGRGLPHRGLLAGTLTGTPCLWFRFKVEERRRSGKSSHWVTIESGEADTPFLLDDGTGRCLVAPAGAELHCRGKDVWYGSHSRARKPGHHRWLQLGGRYRLTEERIHDQDPIYLLGYFQTPRRGAAQKQQLVRGLLSTWKRDPERMASFDTDGDGTVSIEEWELARAKAHQLAEHTESRLQAQPPLSQVSRASDGRHPYVIATLDAETLSRRLGWGAFGGTALFVLAVIGIGFAVGTRLGGAL